MYPLLVFLYAPPLSGVFHRQQPILLAVPRLALRYCFKNTFEFIIRNGTFLTLVVNGG